VQLYIKKTTDNKTNKLPNMRQIVTQVDTNFNVDAPAAVEWLQCAEKLMEMS